jgi:hypothetical protein
MTCQVRGNRFHWCALAAGFLAAGEGRIGDSRYVQRLAYELFEEGAFRDRFSPLATSSSPPSSPASPAGLSGSGS